MLRIKTTKSFRKSLKRYRGSGKFREEELRRVVDMLASQTILPKRYEDHALQGAMAHFRECHVLPDLLLVYRIFEQELVLVLVSFGSHAELFGK
ncbi:MAG: type II toxin-antitoxin system YafQ family toxin [Nanoarchaeota archaeon]|nr:type II toxin-antitoxin system YafQ family toxin [Nanoarchaeota archaeon]